MSVYPKPYDRVLRPVCLVTGDGRARDALHDVIQSMFAITNMMRALMLEGEDREDLAEGVYLLLDQQCALLNGVFEELGAEDDARDAENEAQGRVRQSKTPTEALIEPAHRLRIQFIESNAKAGIEPGLIGAALNLSEKDVQRVVARLRGQEAAPRAAGRAARA